MRVIHASQIQRLGQRKWLVEPHVPLEEVTLLTGDRRAGKGLLCAQLAALASQGKRPAWDMNPKARLHQHRVLWVVAGSGEDRHEEIVARYMAAGGAKDRLSIVEADGHVGKLKHLLRDRRSWKLLVVDPLQALLGDLGSVAARRHMEELVTIARSTNTTLVAIRHLTANGKAARGRGEIADVARSQLWIGKHPTDPELIVLKPAPSSYGEGDAVAFRIDTSGEAPVLRHVGDESWDDDIELVDLQPKPPKRRATVRRGSRERAHDFLVEALKEGPRDRPSIVQLARKRRISERTLERAAADLGVVRDEARSRGRIDRATWALPTEWQTDTEAEDAEREEPTDVLPSANGTTTHPCLRILDGAEGAARSTPLGS
ncbi:MAG: AAA family ATPase [Planctomycetota bacterium]